ncbi:unnamed protein product [Didymodactylos carnosus]|uniref:CCHC-type domain-containing protein n=2 Tax=Didymodactylos carnosus TaxID=1234261 RepID=A0A8S2QFP4_9BILA|nr:unnamed protein product [Didymodactylos carnosus]CAF4101994.1 unnamed protein product [Didymodactylos carnosus]
MTYMQQLEYNRYNDMDTNERDTLTGNIQCTPRADRQNQQEGTPKRHRMLEDDFETDDNVRMVQRKRQRNYENRSSLQPNDPPDKGINQNVQSRQWNNSSYKNSALDSSRNVKSQTVSHQALRYAIDDRLPPIRIQCIPKLTNQKEAANIIKTLLKNIEQELNRLNIRLQVPLGFDNYIVDRNGDLICFTNSIEIFVFFSDPLHIPNSITNVNLKLVQPRKLPPQLNIIMKFVDNNISLEEVKEGLNEQYSSLYTIENMVGTMNEKARHIRFDMRSTDEYEAILNKGKFLLAGRIFDVDEFLPSPKLLICSRCNYPGHMKKNCNSQIDICRRCGEDRNNGVNHQECIVCCTHCGQDHEMTSFRCAYVMGFRDELLRKLKSDSRQLPPNVQLFLPLKYRDQGLKTLRSSLKKSMPDKRVQQHQVFNRNDQNMWPLLNSNSNSSQTFHQIQSCSVANEIKVLQSEFEKIKSGNMTEILKLKQDHAKQVQATTQHIQLFNLQNKIQTEAITDVYTTVCEVMPPIIQTMQLFHRILEKQNANVHVNEHERQDNNRILAETLITINTLSDRLQLANDHHQKLQTLMTKHSELLIQGLSYLDQQLNE